VVASSPVDLAVVGADDRCRLSAYVSSDGGETWAETQQSGEYWQLSPESPEAVRSPVRRTEPGCEVLALSSFTEVSARVLCTDGELRGTADAGANWAGLGDLDGAVSVYYEGPGDAWAVAVTDDCPAAVYSTADGGADWEEQSCLEDGDGQAIAVTNGVITVHLGGQVTTSDDDGASWTSP